MRTEYDDDNHSSDREPPLLVDRTTGALLVSGMSGGGGSSALDIGALSAVTPPLVATDLFPMARTGAPSTSLKATLREAADFTAKNLVVSGSNVIAKVDQYGAFVRGTNCDLGIASNANYAVRAVNFTDLSDPAGNIIALQQLNNDSDLFGSSNTIYAMPTFSRHFMDFVGDGAGHEFDARVDTNNARCNLDARIFLNTVPTGGAGLITLDNEASALPLFVGKVAGVVATKIDQFGGLSFGKNVDAFQAPDASYKIIALSEADNGDSGYNAISLAGVNNIADFVGSQLDIFCNTSNANIQLGFYIGARTHLLDAKAEADRCYIALDNRINLDTEANSGGLITLDNEASGLPLFVGKVAGVVTTKIDQFGTLRIGAHTEDFYAANTDNKIICINKTDAGEPANLSVAFGVINNADDYVGSEVDIMLTANLATVSIGTPTKGIYLATAEGQTTKIEVDAKKVVGPRQIDARIDDAINDASWDATTAGVLASIRDALVTHGLIAAA